MNINITCSIIHLIICVNFKFCTKFYFKVIIDCRSIATRQNRIAILYRYWAGFTFRCHITANVYFTGYYIQIVFQNLILKFYLTTMYCLIGNFIW